MGTPLGYNIADMLNIQFADRGVAMAAVDMMSLLIEVAPHMVRLYSSMPLKILQALCYAIAGESCGIM